MKKYLKYFFAVAILSSFSLNAIDEIRSEDLSLINSDKNFEFVLSGGNVELVPGYISQYPEDDLAIAISFICDSPLYVNGRVVDETINNIASSDDVIRIIFSPVCNFLFCSYMWKS